MQGNPLLGVHIYLYSDDVVEVNCPQGFGDPPGESKALCHAISDADGVFKFKSIPCGNALAHMWLPQLTVFFMSIFFLQKMATSLQIYFNYVHLGVFFIVTLGTYTLGSTDSNKATQD